MNASRSARDTVDQNILYTRTDSHFSEYDETENRILDLRINRSRPSDVSQTPKRATVAFFNTSSEEQQQRPPLHMEQTPPPLPLSHSGATMSTTSGGIQNLPRDEEISYITSYAAVHCRILSRNIEARMPMHIEQTPPPLPVLGSEARMPTTSGGIQNLPNIEKGGISDIEVVHTSGRSSVIVNRSLRCFICDMCFADPEDLMTHARKCVVEKSCQCKICQLGIKDKSNLNPNLLVDSKENLYQCEICYLRYERKFDLNQHLLLHSKKKVHECKICHKSFKRKYNLQVHMCVHSKINGINGYQCKICGCRFKRMIQLDLHNQRFHL